MAKNIILILLNLLNFCDNSRATVIQNYDNGNLEKWRSTLLQRPFESFIGIPYAEPPIGNLRFELPRQIQILQIAKRQV